MVTRKSNKSSVSVFVFVKSGMCDEKDIVKAMKRQFGEWEELSAITCLKRN